MKSFFAWAGCALSILLAAAGLASVLVSENLRATAWESQQGALELYGARLGVARAQEKLGESDLESALQSARSANETALRVGDVTERIVALLRPTAATARASVAASEESVRGAALTRRQTQVAGRVLGAISGYQRDAARYAAITNRALLRILIVLRETNENFPGSLP